MKGKGGEDTGRDGGREVDSVGVFSYFYSSTLIKQFTSIIKYLGFVLHIQSAMRNSFQNINKYVILKYIHCSVLV